MKLTVETRTLKTMFGEWQNALGYTKPFELTLTTPPADGPYVLLHVEPPLLSKHKGSNTGSMNSPCRISIWNSLGIEPGPVD